MEKGMHLLLDAVSVDAARLSSLAGIYDLLEGVPATIGMTVVAPPTVVRFPAAGYELERVATGLREDLALRGIHGQTFHPGPLLELEAQLERRRNGAAGISGFVVIAESHLAIHTWPEHNYVNADLSCCREFDADVVAVELRERLALDGTRTHIQIVRRGMSVIPVVGETRV